MTHRTLSAKELKCPGIISGPPVYEKASVFRQYLMHEKDFRRSLEKILQAEVGNLRPIGVHPFFLLPVRLWVKILYDTKYMRLAVRAAEKLLAPLLPSRWFGSMIMVVLTKTPVDETSRPRQ